jgi:hypothetical protein
MSPPTRREEVRCNMATKLVYHYVDDEVGIDVKSREKLKNLNVEVHYPFRPRTGRPKYTQIRKLTYESIPSPPSRGASKILLRHQDRDSSLHRGIDSSSPARLPKL